MLDRLIATLVASKNPAADELLLEALRLGSNQERAVALDCLLKRATVPGLSGVCEQFESLPAALQQVALDQIGLFHPAIRSCGKDERPERRVAAMKLIAAGRQGKLSYVLSENLHEGDEELARTAAESMTALARWIHDDTRQLQRRAAAGEPVTDEMRALHRRLAENRAEVEAAVARALDLHRGRHGNELLGAALLLSDWAGSKTLAIASTTRHGGQASLVRKLQQSPEPEHVEAFLLGASHGQLRTQFGNAFAHLQDGPTLDGLLAKTFWLKDHQLHLCVHQASRGPWLSETDLPRELSARLASPAAMVQAAEWIAASSLHDVQQDRLLGLIKERLGDDFASKLRLLRIAAGRRRGATTQLLRSFLDDKDERLARMAVREIARRKPADTENLLLPRMADASETVRRVIRRAIGQAGFDHYWERFDRMDRATRRQAGRAMLKLLPDAPQRLGRRLAGGPVEQRVKALQMVHELGLAEPLKEQLVQLAGHPNARVRSKAVGVLGHVPQAAPDVLLDRALADADPRVRANAIEVLEAGGKAEFLPVLAQRARNGHNRERANAIKAMQRMKVGSASNQLLSMLRDQRSEHRVSALWCLKQIGWWQLLAEVANLAKGDQNLKVRRYALAVLRDAAEVLQQTRGPASAATLKLPTTPPQGNVSQQLPEAG
jgi:HEAT repeat protein